MAAQYFEKENQALDEFVIDIPTPVLGEEFDILVTDLVNNSSGANSADVFVKFDNAVPGAVVGSQPLTTQVKVVVEKEFIGDEFNVVAESDFMTIELEDKRSLGVKFQIQSRSQADVGQREAQDDGFRYFADDNPGAKVRMRIVGVDNNLGQGTLTQLSVTAGIDLSDE